MRRFLLWSLIVAAAVLVAGCGGKGSSQGASFAADGRLRVAASLYPVYEFARAVGGDRIDLVNLVPPGVEPHDWEPTPAQIRTLNAADLFLYNGAGFEHWVEDVLGSLDNKALRAVEVSRGFPLLEAGAHGHGDSAGHDEHAEHEHDPHIWLDPAGAVHIVTVIRDALAEADPANRAVYEANAAAYVEELQALDAEMEAGLSRCRTRELFTTHNAFGYLARRYGLTQHPIMGLAPDAEPTPRALREIVEEAKAHEVKFIFFESLASDRVARVVAEEIGAQTLVLNPFEGLTPSEVRAGRDYLSVMRENLANLRLALECE